MPLSDVHCAACSNRQDEISRIRDKISLVTRRKQAALADLEDELRELRASSAELQAAVDERRLTRIH